MSRPLDSGLDQVKTVLLKMGKLANDAIILSIDGYERMEDVHVQIRAWSNTILIMAEEVEDRVVELIALHQPMAGDLRSLKAYLKIAYDLERFGRYALDISDIIRRIGPWEPFSNGELELDLIVGKVKEIVRLALELIETRDQSMIWTLAETETKIDELYYENLKVLGKAQNTSRKTIIADTLLIRYLERIADHASYIAESIAYAVTGKRFELR